MRYDIVLPNTPSISSFSIRCSAFDVQLFMFGPFMMDIE
jgi:hypothetical protein